MTRSLSLVINDGRIVAGLPPNIGWVADTRVAGEPILIALALLLACTGALFTRHAVVFRRFYAAGSNPMAASHSGINVANLITFGYILAGLGAATTGLIQVTRTLSASPLIFESLAIDAITACILGGGSLAGGRGGILGATVGLIVVAATDNLVFMLEISVFWKDFAVGLLLLVVVIWRPASTGFRQLISTRLKAKQT